MSKISIEFLKDAYLFDLTSALRAEIDKIAEDLKKEIQGRVKAIPFNSYIVPLAGESVTSDAERKSSVYNSIQIERYEKDHVYKQVVSALKDNYKDSHIGLYYEYGTGTREHIDSPLSRLGDWNTARGVPSVGAPIVSRTGTWIDAGGNRRVSNATVAGKPLPHFEVNYYLWFRNSYGQNKDLFKRRLERAFRSINIRKYVAVKLPKKISLMR